MGCSSRWLGELQLEPFVAFPLLFRWAGTDDTQLLVFSEIWSLQPSFWRGQKEFKNWVFLRILWWRIARIEVPAPRTRSAALSYSKFLPHFWSLATFRKQQSSKTADSLGLQAACWSENPLEPSSALSRGDCPRINRVEESLRTVGCFLDVQLEQLLSRVDLLWGSADNAPAFFLWSEPLLKADSVLPHCHCWDEAPSWHFLVDLDLENVARHHCSMALLVMCTEIPGWWLRSRPCFLFSHAQNAREILLLV